MQVEGIGQILIRVHDIGRAVSFYRDVLGLPLLFEVPGQSMAFFDCNGVRLYLAQAEGPDFDHAATLYLRVPDIQAAYEELAGKGVEIVDGPHLTHDDGTTQLWLSFFRDSEGNPHALMQEKPSPSG